MKSADLSRSSRKAILNELFTGRLLPGERLVERTMAEKLGVSRIPLREAMAQLVTEGVLVRERERGGVRVRHYAPEDAREVFELRETLEVGAARAACQRATESDFLRLEVLCDEMEERIGQYGSEAWAERDKAFHQSLVAASHNQRLIRHYDVLQAETHALFYRHPARRYRPRLTPEAARRHMTAVVTDHRKIARLLRQRDAVAVEAVLREHLQSAVSTIVRSLLEYERKRNG